MRAQCALPMECVHMPILSPNEAAKMSGVSRRSIMRAIENGELLARRDNRNQWQIEVESLAQWAPNAPAQPTPTLAHEPSSAVLEERIRGLEVLLTEMRTDRDALRDDRDAWRAMAQKPWWKRLVG